VSSKSRINISTSKNLVHRRKHNVPLCLEKLKHNQKDSAPPAEAFECVGARSECTLYLFVSPHFLTDQMISSDRKNLYF